MFTKLRNVFKINEAKPGSGGPIIKDGHIQFNIISITRHFISNLPVLIFSAIVCIIVSGVILYLVPEKYCSHASILPSGKGDDLSVLKEMAGLSGLGLENNENSSVLYPKILNSRQIKEAVINYNYSTSFPTQNETTLKEYFGTTINEYLLSKLDKITSIDSDSKTGLITIAVETEYPELSQAIVQRYLAELEDYNINRRKSSASERVKYLKRESAERETELMQAEDDLEQFQMANRNWNMTSDPGILAELNRKKREIMAKSETYLFLKNQYDLAKLEAQKDIPIVRILDNPSLP
ncbi:MAG: hypothetical protein GY853_09395, partial [PVC group bacterium]|nr:hypothetical protein [PVC group bacterium]